MFSHRYEIIWEQVSELSGTGAGPLDSLGPWWRPTTRVSFGAQDSGWGVSWIKPSLPVLPKSKRLFTVGESLSLFRSM
jgi:hypothetical protein